MGLEALRLKKDEENGMQQAKRVILLACRAGGGHVSAARALTEAFEQVDVSAQTVFIEDVIGPLGGLLR